MQKLVKLEMVGKRQEEEEEPEGEVIAGPSGEAVEHSSGNTPFFLKIKLSFHLHCFTRIFSCMSGFVSLTDESEEKEEVKEVTKEEYVIGVAHSWMQVGGFLALAEEEVQWLLCEVFLFYLI